MSASHRFLPVCASSSRLFSLGALLSFAALVFAGCSSAYYGALEKVGIPKREVLVDRIGKARTAQQDAKEQFADALEHFIAVTQVDTGQLKSRYDALVRELKQSEARATEVRDRIAAIDDVAEALFAEWERELAQYKNADLRRQSQSQLQSTRRRYQDLFAAMERAAARMDPVLDTFRDQVLFLKHNLNAQAVRALDGPTRTLQADTQRLITEMEASIRAADVFIRTLEQ